MITDTVTDADLDFSRMNSVTISASMVSRVLDKPHFFTLIVTASLAKCKAPTCCCQLASACRPLHVAFQAASRGREQQGVSDPGGHATENGSVARVRRRWIGFREALCIRGFMKTCACCSLRGGASAAGPVVCTQLRKTAIGSAWPRDGALLASTFSIRRYVASGSSGATTPGPNGETLAGCVASAEKLASSLTGAKLKTIEQLHFVLRRNSLQ